MSRITLRRLAGIRDKGGRGEGDVRERETAEIISLFQEAFGDGNEDDFSPPSPSTTQNRRRRHRRRLPFLAFKRLLLATARGLRRQRRPSRDLRKKTLNKLFCIAIPRPRYRLSTRRVGFAGRRRRGLKSKKSAPRSRVRTTPPPRSRIHVFVPASRRGRLIRVDWRAHTRVVEKARIVSAETTDFQAAFHAGRRSAKRRSIFPHLFPRGNLFFARRTGEGKGKKGRERGSGRTLLFLCVLVFFFVCFARSDHLRVPFFISLLFLLAIAKVRAHGTERTLDLDSTQVCRGFSNHISILYLLGRPQLCCWDCKIL